MQAPLITEMLFYCSTTLIGIDSVTGIWKKFSNNEGNNKKNNKQTEE